MDRRSFLFNQERGSKTEKASTFSNRVDRDFTNERISDASLFIQLPDIREVRAVVHIYALAGRERVVQIAHLVVIFGDTAVLQREDARQAMYRSKMLAEDIVLRNRIEFKRIGGASLNILYS